VTGYGLDDRGQISCRRERISQAGDGLTHPPTQRTYIDIPTYCKQRFSLDSDAWQGENDWQQRVSSSHQKGHPHDD